MQEDRPAGGRFTATTSGCRQVLDVDTLTSAAATRESADNCSCAGAESRKTMDTSSGKINDTSVFTGQPLHTLTAASCGRLLSEGAERAGGERGPASCCGCPGYRCCGCTRTVRGCETLVLLE